MTITLAAKTEVALTTNPQTISLPSGTTTGDFLVLIGYGSSGTNNHFSDLEMFKGWVGARRYNSNNLVIGIWYKRWLSTDSAPSYTCQTNGYAALYRYTGVETARFYLNDPVVASYQDCPYTSATNGDEIIWAGAVRKSGTPDPTISFSRGSVETNVTDTTAHTSLVTYREALSGDVSGVAATMSTTNTPTYAGAASIVLSAGAGWVYKGRSTASADTAGVA